MPYRLRLTAGISAGALVAGLGTAHAEETRGRYSRVGSGAQQAAAAATARGQRGMAASAAAQRALAAFSRAAATRRSLDAAQATARAAAWAAAGRSGVRNGLGTGGLEVAQGAASDASLWQGANRPTQTSKSGETHVVIKQVAGKAILTWDRFDVGRDTTLTFDQSGGGARAADWIALNRVTDVHADPTRILGKVKAQGQVYLINRNGVLFGGSSQVDVHSLIASSLDFAGDTLAARNKRFTDGILFDPTRLQDNGRLTFGDGADQTPVADSFVKVDAGARLTMDEGGRALLVGPDVGNAGTIASPNGQVMLVAGRQVQLQRNYAQGALPFSPTFDPDLRGIQALIRDGMGGKARNTGAIYVDRGNIWVQGKSVSIGGLLQTTTSALANGSVTAFAGDGGGFGGQLYPDPYNKGPLTIESGATIQMLPDAADGPAVGFSQYRSSLLTMRAANITMADGATIFVPGGRVIMQATGSRGSTDPIDSRLYIDKGATIDVSGLFVDVPMSQNVIQGELRANELRDNPLLRDGMLRGRDVYFDARRGTTLADLTGYYDLIERDVTQLMTGGGTVTLDGRDVILRKGSTINLSGGGLNYGGGYVRSSLLLDEFGRATAIEDAVRGVRYVGFYGDFIVDHPRWGVSETYTNPFAAPRGRYEAGYGEGRSAGALLIERGADTNSQYHARVLDGTIIADVTAGRYQRSAPAAGRPASDIVALGRERPSGASLTMGVRPVAGQVLGGDYVIDNGTTTLPTDFDASTPIDEADAYTAHLSDRLFGAGRFTNVTLFSGASGDFDTSRQRTSLIVAKGATVDLGTYGSFTLRGLNAQIDGTIRAPGGSVTVATLPSYDPTSAPRSITVGGEIDVAGRWVNDLLTPGSLPAPLAIDGGTVRLIASEGLDLRAGSVIDVSGGGQVASNGSVTAGDGGAIALVANWLGESASVVSAPGTRDHLTLAGALRGYALGRGGTLTISAGQGVVIDNRPTLADGILRAGELAPVDLRITAPLRFAAGSDLPFAATLTLTNADPGVRTLGAYTADLPSELPVAADFVVPGDFSTVYTTDGNAYASGQTVPANSAISFWDGPIPAGFVVPADAFPNGIPIAAATVTIPAGITDRAVTLAVGAAIPSGTRLTSDTQVEAPVSLTPGFFRQNGFSAYSIGGARGVTVAGGVTMRPDTLSFIVPDGYGSLATGTRLSDVAATRYLPDTLARPTDVSLSTIWLNPDGSRVDFLDNPVSTIGFGKIELTSGSRILARPEAAIRLGGSDGVLVDGTISTPGGLIALNTGSRGGGSGPVGGGVVQLGANARLLARGYVRSTYDGPLLRRDVEGGGTVRFNADTAPFGTPVFSYVLTDAASVIDVSGIRGTADLLTDPTGAPGRSAFTPVVVSSSGGMIDLRASDGVIAGTLLAGGGSVDAAGGTLTIRQTSEPYGFDGGRAGVPVLTVGQSLTDAVVQGARTLDRTRFGLRVVADRLNGSGADVLRLGSQNGQSTLNASIMAFEGDVSLVSRGAIVLGSSVLTTAGGEAGDISIDAGYIALQSPFENTRGGQPVAQGTAPAGSLTLDARVIDVSYGVDLGCGEALCADLGLGQGFARTTFRARDDIRLIAPNGTATGINTSGSLRFEAAQVYLAGSQPRATGDGFVVNAAGSVTFVGNGRAAPVPLGFGGKLTVRAADIVQGGVLRAPLGEIALIGLNSVTLAPGSLTSTSLGGLDVPFGGGSVVDAFGPVGMPGGQPIRRINLAAPDVTVTAGATLDVSGGGDLIGAQFVSGNGGTQNLLEPGNYYAIVPDIAGSVVPYLEGVAGAPTFFDDRLGIGDRVYLSGSPTLAAGSYLLLPASFAILPGGVLVRPTGDAGLVAPAAAQRRPDGSLIVGGYRVDGFTGRHDTDFASFELLSGNVWRQYSRVDTLSYNAYIAEAAARTNTVARTALDAGTVVLGATNRLSLSGTGRFKPAAGGASGGLDISSSQIAITAPGVAAPDGFLAIDANQLSAFGAGSVLIGGTRDPGASGTTITVNASDVIVDNDAANPLTGTEYLFAATNQVTFRTGSSVVAEGGAPAASEALLLTGNGAFVRASAGGRADVIRSGADGSAGTLDIQRGALLRADGSLSLEGTQTLLLDADARLNAGRLDLSSVTVSIGDVPAGLTGTVLSGRTLASLGTVADLAIRASSSVDLYGSFGLGATGSGSRGLGTLTLDTPTIRGFGTTRDTVAITADTVNLTNDIGPAVAGSDGTGAGRLRMTTRRLVLDAGVVGIDGFAAADIRTDTLTANGRGGTTFDGDARIAAGLVTAARGSDNGLRVDGALDIVSRAGPIGTVSDYGGRLSLSGDSVAFDTAARLPAGVFELTATDGDLTIGANAAIDVGGVSLLLRDVRRSLGGGTVRLGASGAVTTAAGSLLDVAGDTAAGDAGAVTIRAGGVASLSGRLRGDAAAGYRAGDLFVDARRLAGFATLNGAAEAGGFYGIRSIAVRSGDLALDRGATITAHDVLLRSDAGTILVAGAIDASASGVDADGGTIRLIGGNAVTLADGARLDVRAGPATSVSPRPASGAVELVALGGRAVLSRGATIDGRGGTAGGGSLVVAAARVGDDVAIAPLDATLTGIRDIAAVGYADYATDMLDAAAVTGFVADADRWAAGTASIAARLGLDAAQVHAGIRVRSAGDLTVAGAIDLSGARPGGTAGFLDLIAARDLSIDGALSDGFASADRTAGLSTGDSWHYALNAGRDVVVGAGGLVRTGTGAIDIDAGRDLRLVDNLSAIYTAGARTATGAGFVAPADRTIGEFPTRGGDIAITAGRDIVAPLTRQSTSAWLFRYGETNWNGDPTTSTVGVQSSWSVVFPNFEQGIGALGGGDIDVRAGRDVVQLAVALPTTGHLTTPVGDVARSDDLVVRGGGDLSIVAGGDIRGGLFMLGRGNADVRAGGALDTGPDLSLQRDNAGGAFGSLTPRSLAPMFALMDADLRIAARSGVQIEAAFDPMLQGQTCENAICEDGLPGVSRGSAYRSMTERTALRAITASGDVAYRNNPWASVDLTTGTSREVVMTNTGPFLNLQLNREFALMPGTVDLTAPAGYVDTYYKLDTFVPLTMAPTDNGNLDLIAGQAVRLGPNPGPVYGNYVMRDVAAAYRRGAIHPFAIVQGATISFGVDMPDVSTNYDRGFVPAHLNDPEPARLYSLGGSLPEGYQWSLPKPISAYAAQTLSGTYIVQNNRANDISRFLSGHDIRSTFVTVAGVGDVILGANDDIDRSTALSVGQQPNRDNDATRNLALPANQGANIWYTAGLGIGSDYDGFAARYLDPAGGGVIRSYAPELRAYLTSLGIESGEGGDLAAFRALPEDTQRFFIARTFFDELKETGLDVTDPDSPRFQNYARGYDAIRTLFPVDPATLTGDRRGDVTINGLAVETQAGGDINILAPYGRIDVGSNEPGTTSGTGGLITRKGGSIRMMADGDIALYISRVFTLLGGDILMWTSNGDITAGAGAKTSTFRPPLSYTLDNDGGVSINVFGLQTGAGIGVLDAGGTGTRVASRLDLIAPRGEVNAGDAGIRVVGDLNIAALRIVNAANIDVSGEAVGLPEQVAVNIGALTAASSAAAAVTDQASTLAERTKPKMTSPVAPVILTVRLLGFGD